MARLNKLAAFTIALGLTLLLVPNASAHAADAYLILPPPPMGAPPPCVVPGFFPDASPPCYFDYPVTVVDPTATSAAGLVVGAGVCDVVGHGCFAWPTWNPFFPGAGPGAPPTGAPPVSWNCQITSTFGPWFGTVAVYLVQDTANNRILGDVGDVVYTIDLFAGSPFGPLPFGPVVAAGTGAYTGDFFGPGLFLPGMPVHVVAAQLVAGVAVPATGIGLTVTCWIL